MSGRVGKLGGQSLAQPSPDDARFAFESQVRENYGRVAYSHKTHLKMADKLAARQSFYKIAQIVLSALITSGAIGALVFEKRWVAAVTALVSMAQLALSSYLKDVNPGAVAALHCDAASDLWGIREDFLSLIADSRDTSSPLDELKERRIAVQERLAKIYKGAPQTDGDAYKKAQMALQNNEELTFSEAELDRLLPPSLRRGGEAVE